MFTKAYKVYGEAGHRQRESFGSSYHCDWSTAESIRRITVLNCDVTGTNDYTIVIITRESEAECDSEIAGQISDGIFENSRCGVIESFNLN